MRTAIKLTSMVAMAGASYAAFATALIWIFPIYSDPEIRARVQQLILELAGVSFLIMLGCYIAARKLMR